MPHPSHRTRLRRLHRQAAALREEVRRLRRKRHLNATYPPRVFWSPDATIFNLTPGDPATWENMNRMWDRLGKASLPDVFFGGDGPPRPPGYGKVRA